MHFIFILAKFSLNRKNKQKYCQTAPLVFVVELETLLYFSFFHLVLLDHGSFI